MTEMLFTLVTIEGDLTPSLTTFDSKAAATEALHKFQEAHAGQEYKAYIQIQSLNRSEFFPVSFVTRDDLEVSGYDTSNMTDSDMERLADKMGDAYCDDGYWIDLEIIAENCFGLSKA